MQPETTSKVASNAITKGDVLAVSRVAGIQAAKQTALLIPLCHPLLVGAVTINFTIGDDYVEVETQVETVDRTGVEMEALTACAVAALTIYDMCKSFDRAMVIGELALWEKTGGRTGHWRRDADAVFSSTASEVARSLPIEDRIDGLIGSDSVGFDG
jgi:cyclic pyranopterin phosphate synthase